MSWPAVFLCHPQPWGSPDDASAAYTNFWEQVESAARVQAPQKIPQRQLGRGRARQVQIKHGNTHAPLRLGRLGDVEPGFVGVSRQHALWFRQLGRLQAYVRYTQAHRQNLDAIHAANVWGAISRAKGFDGDFGVWWKHCDAKVYGAPAAFPLAPPSYDVALALYESFTLAVRALEMKLCKHSRDYARARRQASPNLIFQDIRQPGPETVDLLLKPLQAKVTHIHEHDCSIVVDTVLPWDDSKPLFCDGESFDIVISCEDQLWVADVSHFQVGQLLHQTKHTGSLPSLFAEFCDTWKARWYRHQTVPLSHWGPIVRFVRQRLPKVDCPMQSMTPDDLQAIFRSRKKKPARGLDGVSLEDARAFPREAKQVVCEIFQHAERTGCWPDQLVSGRVASLAKTSTPVCAADYRPITILSIFYRAWGTFHAKKFTKALDAILPSTLYGSRVGRHASQVWFHVLSELELAGFADNTLSGWVADVEKAFNHIPRPVILDTAAHVGLPPDALLGWTGALTQMLRFFQIRGSLSAPVASVTGVARGRCPLMCGNDVNGCHHA